MIWALDGQVAGARGRGRAPGQRRPRSAAVLAICNDAPDPGHRRPPGAAACAARACPLHGGVVLDLTAIDGHRRRRPRVDGARRAARARSARGSRTTLRAEHGVTIGHWPQSIDLSTVGGWLACRGAGQMSTRYGKIEDIVVGLDVVLADGRTISHRRRAACRGRPRPHPAVRRLGGHARRHHRRPAAAAPDAADRAARRVRVPELRRGARRVPADHAPRRDARGAPALRRDRGRPLVPDRRRRSPAARARRRRRRPSSTRR